MLCPNLIHGKWPVCLRLFVPCTVLTHHEALERATYSSKSFLIGLALVLEKITVEEAALASTVEVSSQIQRWGEVEDCELVFCLPRHFLCLSTAHDVDHQDVRRQLASAACLLEDSSLSQ
jgi:ATP synthase F1 complex assembly factor 2